MLTAQKHLPRKSKAGFTLVELLVAMAIMAMILVALLLMLSSFLKVRNSDETDQVIKTEGNYALDRIEFLVRNGLTMPDICCPNAGDPNFANQCVQNSGIQNALTVLLEENRAAGRRYIYNSVNQNGNAIWLEVDGVLSRLTSTAVLIDNLQFECNTENYGRPNASAFVTVGFDLLTSEISREDTLSDFRDFGQHFQRNIAVGNNHTYIRP